MDMRMIRTEVVTAPTVYSLTFREIEEALQLGGCDVDDSILQYLRAAEKYLEKRTGGHVAVPTVYKQIMPAFPKIAYSSWHGSSRVYPTSFQSTGVSSGFRLLKFPFDSAAASPSPNPKVEYYSDSNVNTELTSNDWQLTHSEQTNSIVDPTVDTQWPSTKIRRDAVRVTYAAGYAGTASVPADYKHALKLLLEWMWTNRTPVVIGTISKKLEYTLEEFIGVLKVGTYAPATIVAS